MDDYILCRSSVSLEHKEWIRKFLVTFKYHEFQNKILIYTTDYFYIIFTHILRPMFVIKNLSSEKISVHAVN